MSSPVRPRGKFLNVAPTTTTVHPNDYVNTSSTSLATGTVASSSLPVVDVMKPMEVVTHDVCQETLSKTTISNTVSVTASMASHPTIDPAPNLRRNPIFEELEKAEILALRLLNLTASTAENLSTLASSSFVVDTTKHDHHQQLHHHHHHSSKIHQTCNEVLKKNGKDYVETLRQVHSILLPYAPMVKSYQVQSNVEESPPSKSIDPDIHLETKKNQKENMYASRMELHLALERKEILQELLELEEHENRQFQQKFQRQENNEACTMEDISISQMIA